jgi:hypothetical protein
MEPWGWERGMFHQKALFGWCIEGAHPCLDTLPASLDSLALVAPGERVLSPAVWPPFSQFPGPNSSE